MEDKSNMTAVEQAPAESTPVAETVPAKKKVPNRKRKKRIKLIIILAVVLLVMGAIAFGIVRLFQKSDEQEPMVESTYRGTLQMKVSGSGPTRALVSETLKTEFATTIDEYFVEMGQMIHAGEPMYSVNQDKLRENLEEAQNTLNSMRVDYNNLVDQPRQLNKQIEQTRQKINDLTFRAPFAGKIMNVQVKSGDELGEGSTVATLVDDSTLRLKQYFSYAYINDIKTGMSATISIPSSMSNLPGRVETVNLVERISTEGSKLFEVVFVLSNPGTLTEGTAASASLSVSGESITPYEAGSLEFNRSQELVCKAGGTISSVNMLDFQRVASGAVLMRVSNDQYAGDLTDLANQIEVAQLNAQDTAKKLQLQQEEVEKIAATIGDSVVYSPVTGTVTSLMAEVGRDLERDTAVATVSDASVILIDAQIDAMNVADVQVGAEVEVIQDGMEGEQYFYGTITSVSLEGQSNENGYSYFPAVIQVDNPDGMLLTGNYVSYNMVTRQVDDCVIAPVQAVKYTDQGAVLMVKADERPENAIDLEGGEDVPEGFYPVPVEVGMSDNASVEIISGVDEDVEVFTQYMTDEGSSWGY